MLSCILNSQRAIEVNIQLIRIFSRLREMIASNKEILDKLNQLENRILKHDEDIRLIFTYLKELFSPKTQPMRRIGFRQKDTEDRSTQMSNSPLQLKNR